MDALGLGGECTGSKVLCGYTRGTYPDEDNVSIRVKIGYDWASESKPCGCAL